MILASHGNCNARISLVRRGIGEGAETRDDKPEETARKNGQRRCAGGGLKKIYVVGTADTKGQELAYLATLVRATGADAEAASFGAPLDHLQQTDRRKAVRLSLHINDTAFSAALVDAYRDIAR
jgi:hypothetical protein